MAINAIGNGIPFPKGKSIPSSIKKSMVLWYDLKRQDATNETMKANPKLIDDVDASSETTFRRWMATMIGNGVPIDWYEII